jgi:hypothetical protein
MMSLMRHAFEDEPSPEFASGASVDANDADALGFPSG